MLLQRVSIRQTESVQCFGCGINEQILFEEGMRLEIERIMKIQMYIAFISSTVTWQQYFREFHYP